MSNVRGFEKTLDYLRLVIRRNELTAQEIVLIGIAYECGVLDGMTIEKEKKD